MVVFISVRRDISDDSPYDGKRLYNQHWWNQIVTSGGRINNNFQLFWNMEFPIWGWNPFWEGRTSGKIKW